MQKGNKAMGGVLGVIVLIGAAWFGIDLNGSNGETTTTTASSTKSSGSSASPVSSNVESCALDTLPNQADDVVDDILAGGPFDYPDNDGTRFGNYEGVLPKEQGNFYREYTVETEGLNHRGPRRIVTGGSNETDPETWFYTDDHYESFCQITDAEG